MRLYSYEVDQGITTMQSTLTSSQQKLAGNHCRGDESLRADNGQEQRIQQFLKKAY